MILKKNQQEVSFLYNVYPQKYLENIIFHGEILKVSFFEEQGWEKAVHSLIPIQLS